MKRLSFSTFFQILQVKKREWLCPEWLQGWQVRRNVYEDIPDSYRDTDDSDDEVVEYDTSSDEEETETAVSEPDRGSTFLLGTTTRFGRQVRINSSTKI